MKLRVALLWHMHQPMYTDPITGEFILPWVRFHATHAYYDMGRLLERHPSVRVTVNFVPSLLEQLEAIAAGGRRERYLDLTRAPAESLGPDERAFVVRQFFMASREQSIRPLPRYWELLLRRGEEPSRIRTESFSVQDLRDIQVLFNLAWMGFAARADEPDVSRLIAKGSHFSEEDKTALLEAQQRIVRRVIPMWRRLADGGQVELSTTPYYHPILPLLCDSDAARRAMPDARLPPRFSHPEDAQRHVRMAIDKHAQLFGRAPAGMWPAEGSVSPEALEVFAREGVRWIATDEGNLFRSQPTPAHHGELYQAWECAAGDRSIAIAFRDRAVSDRVGFTYSRQRESDAVDDLVAHLRRAEAEARRAGVANPIVPIVLDGENAWEHYPEHGELFLDALYRALGSEPWLETLTMSEALSRPTARLTRVHSGSWIESNYRIWIGHAEDNLGWELLGRVRELLARHEGAGDVPAERLEQARQLVMQAEGSDWFWWYGDDFQTDNAAEFDALFRERLIRAATLLGETAPWRLNEPLSGRARDQAPRALAFVAPTAVLHPSIDGRAVSYTEWLGAGSFRPAPGHGSMYRSENAIQHLHFGCDEQHLYVRLDPATSLDGTVVRVTVGNGRSADRAVTIPIDRRGALKADLEGARAAYVEVVEAALPLTSLGLGARDRLELSVQLRRGEIELERLPEGGSLAFEVPDRDFENRHWFV